MDYLINKYQALLQQQRQKFVRSLAAKINWKARAVSIEGARGTGKSTLMLQHIKNNLDLDQTLYISLDDIYFQEHRFSEVADEFYKQGGRYLFADEVHKYPGWQREIKNVYDFYPDLKLVVSGSSILALQRSQVDLSRRLLKYRLPELSFREFIAIKEAIELPFFSLQEVLAKPNEVVRIILKEIASPLKLFKEYLAYGAYPFFTEGEADFSIRLNQLINMIIDYDLPEAMMIETTTQAKLKKLLYVISTLVPFKPNITKLADKVKTSRSRLLQMLDLLEKAQLIYNLRAETRGISLMNKPEKIFLRNPNLIHVLSDGSPNKGNVRETFFLSQLMGAGHSVSYPNAGDFLIDREFTFEIGGKNKTNKQIKEIKKGIVAADDIEYGYGSKIPLWLLGFLY